MFLKVRFARPCEQFSFSYERDFQFDTVMLANATAVERLHKTINLFMARIVGETRKMLGDLVSDPLQDRFRIVSSRRIGAETHAKPEGDRQTCEEMLQRESVY